MATVHKRIIAAAFAAAVAAGSLAVPAPAAATNLDGVPDQYDQELVEWCLDELNTTYQIYRTGPVPAAAIQKLQALFYASAVSLGKAAYAQYEPDFEGNLRNMRTGFYFDVNGDLHVSDLFACSGVSHSKLHLVIISDEHYTTYSGLYDIGESSCTGYDVRVLGNDIGSSRLVTYFNNNPTYYYYNITNDNGDTYSASISDTVEYNLARPATVCQSFPPGEYGSYMGYLEITDENNNPVYLRNNALPITEDVLASDTGTVVNYINNYIVENYPLSDVVVPEPKVIATLPNDEYSGLPAGWNEINPVLMPDIQTPSLPVYGSEDFSESIDGLQFLSTFRDGLGFWARAVSWICEQFPLAARVLLALGLLGLLAFIFWRWSL